MDTQPITRFTVTDLHETARTKFIQAGQTVFAYREFGNMAAMPLILLQHFTGTMDNWDPQVTNGLAVKFRLILFDNKGIGASSGETPETIDEMARDTVAFIKVMRLQKVNILGFSMGGSIAQQVALNEPALINKLILAGTGPKGSVDIAKLVTPLTESAAMEPDDQKLYLFYEKTQDSRVLGEQAIKRINKRIVNRDPETALLSIKSQLKSILDWAVADDQALNQLGKISQPVLVVNGSNDIIVPTINSYLLFQHLPNAKLNLYPDSGHGAIFQYPEWFLANAISFLNAA